jgi:hypothetical protein
MSVDLRGKVPESWRCIDCGVNTSPGNLSRVEMEMAYADQDAAGALLNKESISIPFNESCEVYSVRDSVWRAAGMKPMGGCLCIGCLEKRLGRALLAKDFLRNHPFNRLPGTARLLERRSRVAE